MTNIRLSIRAGALTGVLVFALGLTACGGSDGGDAGAAGHSADSKAAVRKVMQDHYAALFASDEKAFCEGMTEETAAETGERVGKGKTCEEVVNSAVPGRVPAATVGVNTPKTISVDIDGDAATIRTHAVRKGDPPGSVKLVKEEGVWKVVGPFKVREGK